MGGTGVAAGKCHSPAGGAPVVAPRNSSLPLAALNATTAWGAPETIAAWYVYLDIHFTPSVIKVQV